MSFIKRLFEKKRYIVIAAAVLTILMLLLAIGLVSTVALANTHFYSGIHIGDIDISGLTRAEAEEAVSARYGNALSNTVTLMSGDFSRDVALSDLGAELDLSLTLDTAYGVGRTGNIFNRLREIYMVKNDGFITPPILACDEAALGSLIDELAMQVDLPEQDMQVEIIENEMVITRGKPGIRILREKAIERFKKEVLLLSDGILHVEPEEIIPPDPDAENLYTEFCGEPVNAGYTIENQSLVYTEEKNGILFNKEDAQRIIAESTGDVIKIPVTVTPPEITLEQVKSELFPDLLGRYTTSFNAGDTSRSYNIRLACQKINEVVLGPGDVFSYNDTVGPRTVAAGFRTANVYVGNKVEPGIGGGICQVSSTLFNAAVLADLNIVYRTNHSLPVSYVPLGRDATVSYGSIDFKFSNSTNAPVKIVASASGGKNVIAIYGVKENKNRTIDITTQNTGYTAAKLVQKENPDLPEGTVQVEQAGSNGSSYNTYKVTKENGSVVKTELLTKSTYVAADRIEIIGTAPVTSEENPADPAMASPAPIEGTEPTPEPSAKASATPFPLVAPAAGTPEPTPEP